MAMAEKKRISKKTVLTVCTLVLVLLVWILAWRYIGKRMEQAALETQYTHFTYNGAIYARCTADLAAEAYDLHLTGSPEDQGDPVGKVQFTVDGVTVHCEAYRAKALEKNSVAEPVLLVQRDDSCIPYELVGFTSLSDSPSVTAVCQAYGIASATDILSVTVYDADGAMVQQLTESEELASFYQKLIALGEDMGAVGQSKAYYDAYVDKYGESDAITLKEGVIETADDETYQQAMELWGTGMCTVTMKLANGLRLADMVYAPIPKVFQVYGYYAATEPFFE